MKPGKHRIAVLMALALVFMTGCIKTYSFDFTKEHDLQRDDGNWYTTDSDYSLTSLGLLFDYCLTIAPHSYSGHISLSLEFSLAVSQTNSANMSLLFFAPGSVLGDAGFIGIDLLNMGRDDARYMVFNGNNPDGRHEIASSVSTIPGIVIDGMNILEISKDGDSFTFALNDVTIISGVIAPLYYSELFCPAFNCLQDVRKQAVLFKRIKVSCDGEKGLWQ